VKKEERFYRGREILKQLKHPVPLVCPIKAVYGTVFVSDCEVCKKWMRVPLYLNICPCYFLPKDEVVKRYHRRCNYFEIPKWKGEEDANK